MKQILKNLVAKFCEPKIVVRDATPMTPKEYIYAFLIDDSNPFLKAVYQLCDTMKEEYSSIATNSELRPEVRWDGMARMSAIDELKRNIIAQREVAIRERDNPSK